MSAARLTHDDGTADRDAAAALGRFTGSFAPFRLLRIERVGFSGSSIWKVCAVDPIAQARFPDPLCLKRWPADHPPPARLPWIHQVLNQARDQGLSFIPALIPSPDGQTTCEVAGSTWELMSWLPGDCETNRSTTAPRIAAACRALARFHEATRSNSSIGPAPALLDRRERWDTLQSGTLAEIRSAVSQRRIPQLDDLARAWLNKHNQLDGQLAARLAEAVAVPLTLQPAIRDLWRDHVLFTGDEVTGFVDFGAMRIDTPLTDLARLIGSLAGDDSQLRQVALDAYSAIRPLSPKEVRLIDLLDHTGVILSGWNWLDWLYRQDRRFPSLAAVRERVEELLNRERMRS